jgi:prepilin-type N-terminal cleavage/methylation domain-containing protein
MGRLRLALDRRGFTLFEVLVTLLVLALLAGLAVPLIARSTESVRARAEVAGFSAVLRHARERAITSQRAHAVVVDPDAHRVTILLAGTDEVRERRTLPARLRVEADPPPALTVRFEPQGTSTGGDFRLATGAVVYRVTVDPLTGRVRSRRE